MESHIDIVDVNLNETDWYYKGEGNANLVIALTGEQKVIRIRKHEEGTAEDTEVSHDRARLVHYEKVILPLFSDAYFQLPKLARIDQQQVNQLNELLRDVRPKFRQKKKIMPGYVTVFEDLTLLPNRLLNKISGLRRNVTENHSEVIGSTDRVSEVIGSTDRVSEVIGSTDRVSEVIGSTDRVFCVEIKPKQGWQALSDRKYRKCSFCLNQYLKLSDKSIEKISGYCPLDLFSGEKSRMLNAINSLLASPQNNIRIFRNGSLIFADGLSIDEALGSFGWHMNSDCNKDNLSALLLNMLTRNITGQQEDEFARIATQHSAHRHTDQDASKAPANVPERVPSESIAELNALLANTKPCDFSSQSLPLNSILDKILKIQKLDTLGADYVYNDYVSKRNTSHGNSPSLMVNQFPTDLDPIQSYLLSTMAKDCSILIAFQRIDNLAFIEDSVPVAEDLLKNKYVFLVNIADVDAKPVQCIEVHYQRDRRIVQAALDLLRKQ